MVILCLVDPIIGITNPMMIAIQTRLRTYAGVGATTKTAHDDEHKIFSDAPFSFSDDDDPGTSYVSANHHP
jgi:hypothetical protein